MSFGSLHASYVLTKVSSAKGDRDSWRLSTYWRAPIQPAEQLWGGTWQQPPNNYAVIGEMEQSTHAVALHRRMRDNRPFSK